MLHLLVHLSIANDHKLYRHKLLLLLWNDINNNDIVKNCTKTVLSLFHWSPPSSSGVFFSCPRTSNLNGIGARPLQSTGISNIVLCSLFIMLPVRWLHDPVHITVSQFGWWVSRAVVLLGAGTIMSPHKIFLKGNRSSSVECTWVFNSSFPFLRVVMQNLANGCEGFHY